MSIYAFAYLWLQFFYNTNVEIIKIESTITNNILGLDVKKRISPTCVVFLAPKSMINALLKLPSNKKKKKNFGSW